MDAGARDAAKGFDLSFAKMAGAVAVGQAAFEAFKAAGTLGLSAVTSALSGIGSAFTKSIDAAAQMETLETAFIPLLGSADAAQKRIEELAKFAASTPFELPEIAKASRTLETLTRGALATGDGLRLVGDIAAGTNQPFEEVATTIGRLYDGLQSGRPVGEAMQRLQELGAVSGETRTQIEELSKAGKNTEAWLVAEEALNRFNGSMKLQSGTWNGLLSTLSDSITNAYAKFGAPIIDKLKPYLQGIIASVEVLTEKAAALGKSFAENFIASEKSVNSFQTALNAISTGQLGAGFSLFWESLKLQTMQTGNFIINAFTAAFQTVSEIISNIFRSDGPTFMLIKSAFDFVAGYIKEKVAGSLADTFAGMGPMFSNMTKSLKQSAEAGATSAELALQRIPVAAELAAEDIGTNLAGSVGKFKQNLAEANTEFFNTSEQAKKVSELEAQIAAKIKEGNQNRAEANEEIKLTGTFAEKMATLEAAYKDAVDSGNTSLADRITKMGETLRAAQEGKKLAEKEAEKKEEARKKEEELKEQKKESLYLDLQIAEALAGGNEEQAKALQYQKDFNGYLKQAIDAGMGDAAESFATAMARAAGSAKNIKEELSESAKLMSLIDAAEQKNRTDPGGKLEDKVKSQTEAGDFAGARRTAEKLGRREEAMRLEDSVRGVGKNRDNRSMDDILKDHGMNRQLGESLQDTANRILEAREGKTVADKFGRSISATEPEKSLKEKMAERSKNFPADSKPSLKDKQAARTESFRDRMAGKSSDDKKDPIVAPPPVDKPGQSGKTADEAKGETAKKGLEGLVDSIKTLLEKIEPRLPVAALTA